MKHLNRWLAMIPDRDFGFRLGTYRRSCVINAFIVCLVSEIFIAATPGATYTHNKRETQRWGEKMLE
jgi:hypothetical protein